MFEEGGPRRETTVWARASAGEREGWWVTGDVMICEEVIALVEGYVLSVFEDMEEGQGGGGLGVRLSGERKGA